jgi:hypothetical protein
MKIIFDTPLIDKNSPPDSIYQEIKKFIKDKKIIKQMDEIIEELNQKEFENFIFYGDFADYMDENVLPEGYAFGIHEITKEIGFWKIGEDGSSLNVEYDTVKKSSNKKQKAKVLNQEYLDPIDIEKDIFTNNKSKRYIISKINKIFDNNRKQIIRLLTGE